MAGHADVFTAARELPGNALVAALDLAAARECNKYGCPACGSSDGLHAYASGLHCYACGAGAVDVAAVAWGCEPRQAAERLLGCPEGLPRERVRRHRHGDRRAVRVDGPALAVAVAETLSTAPLPVDAWEWLRARGLAPEGTELPSDLFGVAPEGWRTFGQALATAGASTNDLSASGLADAWRGAFGWLVALYRDPRRRPNAVRLRAVTPPPPWWKGRPPAGGKWANLRGCSPAWPWRAERAAAARTVILAEGETDCMALELASAGAPGVAVLAVPGATTWRDKWSELLDSAKRVYILADCDDAGEALAAAVAQSCDHAEAWQVRRVGAKDACDLAKVGRLGTALQTMGVLA